MQPKAYVSQTYPRLTVYEDEGFTGRSRVFTGNVGISNTDRIVDGIESLRFFSTSSNATLVLFTRTGFRGNFRILRGNRSIRDLDDLIAGNDVESIISTNQRLTVEQVRAIRNAGQLPAGYTRV
ncbi:hypothetical protein [Paenibacillus senegalensis]|uniref:hypothetical protein n=1 Tax=Paenibacillus senegalensis TaxID=1465766 RepID=UPI0002887D78|nr:hypothetical protein [Paenibacillus senegalensis]